MLDPTTISASAAMIMIFACVITGVAWLRGEKDTEVKYWFLASALQLVGGAFLALDNTLPLHAGALIGATVVVMSTGYLHLGFQRLFRLPLRFGEVYAVSFAMGALTFLLLLLSGEAANFLSLLYFGTTIHLILAVRTVHGCLKNEPLPSGNITLLVLTLYALGNISLFPVAYLYPAEFVRGIAHAKWLSVTTIPLILLDLTTYLMALALKLERATEQQRILATRDMLTGLLNRRAFYDMSYDLSGQQGVVAIIDLDHFKAVNDNHGHQSGDDVLNKFAQAATAALPANAVFSRLGGEEFGIILKGSDGETAASLLETLRTVVSAIEFRSTSSRTFRISFSCGFSFTNDIGAELDRVMIQADNALYVAKASGRNRVLSYEDTLHLREQENVLMQPAEPLQKTLLV